MRNRFVHINVPNIIITMITICSVEPVLNKEPVAAVLISGVFDTWPALACCQLKHPELKRLKVATVAMFNTQNLATIGR